MINFSPFFLSSNDKKRFQLVLTVWKKESIVVWWHKVPCSSLVWACDLKAIPYHSTYLIYQGKDLPLTAHLYMPCLTAHHPTADKTMVFRVHLIIQVDFLLSMFFIWWRISVRHIDSPVVFKYTEALTSAGESSICSCIFWSCRSYLLRPSLLSPSTHIAVSPPSASIAGTVMRTHEKMHIPHRCYLITYTTKHYPVPVFSFLFVVVFSLFWLRKKCTHVFNESPKNIL